MPGTRSYSKSHYRGLPVKTAVISGGAAGNHTVTGIFFGTSPRHRDELMSVIALDGSSSWLTEADADLDDINDYNAFQSEQNGVIGGNYTIVGQAGATLLGAGEVRYRIDGEEHVATLATGIVLTTVTAVTGSNVKTWRIEIDKLGAVTTTTYAGAGVASAEIALLQIGSVALTANTCVLGYWTVTAATGFTPATDNTSGEAAERTDYQKMSLNQAAALTAAMGSALVAGAGLATVAVGTSDFRQNGLRVAQIAADATLALTDADTITTTEAGGWLVLSDLAGTGYVTLSSDGTPGVTALTDTNAAGAQTALDLLASRLPPVFVPLGQVIVVTANAATFTAKTTFWDATDVTTTVADQTFGVFDRTAVAATVLARQSNPPAIPASIAATVPVAAGVDLTSEFSLTADDTINNAAGTATTGMKLLVIYNDYDA